MSAFSPRSAVEVDLQRAREQQEREHPVEQRRAKVDARHEPAREGVHGRAERAGRHQRQRGQEAPDRHADGGRQPARDAGSRRREPPPRARPSAAGAAARSATGSSRGRSSARWWRRVSRRSSRSARRSRRDSTFRRRWACCSLSPGSRIVMSTPPMKADAADAQQRRVRIGVGRRAVDVLEAAHDRGAAHLDRQPGRHDDLHAAEHRLHLQIDDTGREARLAQIELGRRRTWRPPASGAAPSSSRADRRRRRSRRRSRAAPRRRARRAPARPSAGASAVVAAGRSAVSAAISSADSEVCAQRDPPLELLDVERVVGERVRERRDRPLARLVHARQRGAVGTHEPGRAFVVGRHGRSLTSFEPGRLLADVDEVLAGGAGAGAVRQADGRPPGKRRCAQRAMQNVAAAAEPEALGAGRAGRAAGVGRADGHPTSPSHSRQTRPARGGRRARPATGVSDSLPVASFPSCLPESPRYTLNMKGAGTGGRNEPTAFLLATLLAHGTVGLRLAHHLARAPGAGTGARQTRRGDTARLDDLMTAASRSPGPAIIELPLTVRASRAGDVRFDRRALRLEIQDLAGELRSLRSAPSSRRAILSTRITCAWGLARQ